LQNTTTLTIRKETWLRLLKRGSKGETFDAIITVLLDNEEAVEKAAKESAQQ